MPKLRPISLFVNFRLLPKHCQVDHVMCALASLKELVRYRINLLIVGRNLRHTSDSPEQTHNRLGQPACFDSLSFGRLECASLEKLAFVFLELFPQPCRTKNLFVLRKHSFAARSELRLFVRHRWFSESRQHFIWWRGERLHEDVVEDDCSPHYRLRSWTRRMVFRFREHRGKIA